jgi:myo-inositol-1(or 4)-monophosphatase
MSSRPELRFILETALSAGRLAMSHFHRDPRADGAFDTKSASIDLVTAADREVEAAITGAIAAAFPGDAILAEETASSLPGGMGSLRHGVGAGGVGCGGPLPLPPDRLWVLDPIDGTTNFAHRFPHFSVSLAFCERGRAVAGAVYCPAEDELFAAELGGGATLNGRPIRVSKVDRVNQSLLATGYAYDRRERPEFYLGITRTILMNSHGLRRGGSAALDLCWVAAGRLDAHIESSLKPWDMAAGRLVLEEAGGRFSDFVGAPAGLAVDEVIASNGALHDELVALFRIFHDGAIPAVTTRPAS